MKGALRSNDVLVVKSIDRFGRDYEEIIGQRHVTGPQPSVRIHRRQNPAARGARRPSRHPQIGLAFRPLMPMSPYKGGV